MQEWLDHMKTIHSDQWTQKIHMSTWYCDVDHDFMQFNDHISFIEHMKDSTNHRSRPSPTELQLDALSRNRKRMLIRQEEYSCPLCDSVPDSIKPVIRTSNSQNIKDA